MASSKANYCEIWLSTDGDQYRVALRARGDTPVPPGFICDIPEGESDPVCVSQWYSSVKEAKYHALTLHQDLQQQECKVMFYFEIRLPIVGNLHESTSSSSDEVSS